MKRARIIRPLVVSFTFVLGAFAMTGCATEPGVAAEVDGKIITESQVETVTSEISDFYREGGLDRSPLRIDAVDALIYKEIADSKQGDEQTSLPAFKPDEVRGQLKQQIDQSCEQGKEQLKVFANAEGEAAEDAKAELSDSVDQICNLSAKVDDLSDDAAVFEAIGSFKQSNQIPLMYLAVNQHYPDIDVKVAPRYGKLDQSGLRPNAPESVFFAPRQG